MNFSKLNYGYVYSWEKRASQTVSEDDSTPTIKPSYFFKHFKVARCRTQRGSCTFFWRKRDKRTAGRVQVGYCRRHSYLYNNVCGLHGAVICFFYFPCIPSSCHPLEADGIVLGYSCSKCSDQEGLDGNTHSCLATWSADHGLFVKKCGKGQQNPCLVNRLSRCFVL